MWGEIERVRRKRNSGEREREVGERESREDKGVREKVGRMCEKVRGEDK